MEMGNGVGYEDEFNMGMVLDVGVGAGVEWRCREGNEDVVANGKSTSLKRTLREIYTRPVPMSKHW